MVQRSQFKFDAVKLLLIFLTKLSQHERGGSGLMIKIWRFSSGCNDSTSYGHNCPLLANKKGGRRNFL